MARENVAAAAGATQSRWAEELQESVKDRLNGRVQAFQLIVENGGLVLRGSSRTYYGKQMAQHLVMEATEVPILANRIEVWAGKDLPKEHS